MENNNYIVAVDLGDSNVVVAVGTAASGGQINVEHIFSKPSKGVRAGKIENINQAIESIESVLDELREQTGIKPLELYAGISGEFIYCTSHTDHVYVPDHKFGVTQQVVDALSERMNNVMVSEERFIMERIPQRYVINGSIEVDNPVGVFGSPLSSTFNFISADNEFYCRLDMAIRRLSITPRKIFSNAVVVGDAVLTPDEKEEGVVVIDMGGDLTDIAIYRHNILRYISTIPIGAKAINNDIRTLTIPERYIEKLKINYGCALSDKVKKDFSVIIKGRSKHDHREIAVYNLAAVIEARARDIAELILQEIEDSGFADSLTYGIVLTGGSAQLRGIGDLIKEVTDYDVRIAEPEEIVTADTVENITSSADSTVVGLLLHGMKYGACEVEKVESRHDKERKEQEAKRAEQERLRKEQEERERQIAEEKARRDREEQVRREAELKREQEALAKQQAEEEAARAAKAAEEANALALAAAQAAQEAAEKLKATQQGELSEEQKAQEQIKEAQRQEAQRQEAQRQEAQRQEAQRQEAQRAEQQRIEAEKAAEAEQQRVVEEQKKAELQSKTEAEQQPAKPITSDDPKQPKRTLPPPPPLESGESEENEDEENENQGNSAEDQSVASRRGDRMKRFLAKLSVTANKVVDNVNGHFDVKNDDEEV